MIIIVHFHFDLSFFDIFVAVAALMVTVPNTLGVFESEIRKMAELLHAKGAYLYCDGANFNAIVGRVRPGDLGVDAMHINLHKTFSTPHGGGGPGSGPVVLSEALSPFAPLPFTTRRADGTVDLIEEENAGEEHPHTFGRMCAFHGQMGMFTRALAYILSHGADGLRQASGDAVLNANYLLARLREGCSEFAGWWEAHDVSGVAAGRKSLIHPKKGRLKLEYASFQANDDPALKLVIYTTV